MPTIDIDFDWPRSLEYELASSKGAPVIRQKSARLERCFPLREDGSLYLRFAQLDGSPAQCLAFARSWGFLYGPPKTLPGKGAEEEIDLWHHQIKFMRAWIQVCSSGLDGGGQTSGFRSRQKIASVDVLLDVHPLGRRAVVLKPSSLMDAMMLQFAQAQASNASIAACQKCGKT